MFVQTVMFNHPSQIIPIPQFANRLFAYHFPYPTLSLLQQEVRREVHLEVK